MQGLGFDTINGALVRDSQSASATATANNSQRARCYFSGADAKRQGFLRCRSAGWLLFRVNYQRASGDFIVGPAFSASVKAAIAQLRRRLQRRSTAWPSLCAI